jgi:hypothetical protein
MRFKNDEDSARYLIGPVLSDSMNSESDKKTSAYLTDIVGKAFQLFVMYHVTWKVYKRSVVHSVIVRFSDLTDMKHTVLKHLMRHLFRMEEIACRACSLTESDKKHMLPDLVYFFESSGRTEYEIGPNMTDSTASSLVTITQCEETSVPIMSMVWFREGVHEELFLKLCREHTQQQREKKQQRQRTSNRNDKKRKDVISSFNDAQNEAQSVVAMASYMKRINGARTVVTPASPEEIQRKKEANKAEGRTTSTAVEKEGEIYDTNGEEEEDAPPCSAKEREQTQSLDEDSMKSEREKDKVSVARAEFDEYEKLPEKNVIVTDRHVSSTVVVIPASSTKASAPSSAVVASTAAPPPCQPLRRARLVARLPGRPYNPFVIAV